MKKVFLILILTAFTFTCKNKTKAEETNQESQEMAYASFGDQIEADGAITASEMSKLYKSLNVGDTLTTKVEAKINEVCQMKGCWMKLDLGNDEEVMVRFKDYGFFVPLNAEGDVIVNGKAYITETSVDELRHYAEDAGKPAEEIAAITQSEISYAFEADGVLLKQ